MNEQQQAEFDSVARLIDEYFRLAELASASSPPPGRNAANGYFIGAMRSGEFDKLQNADPAPTDGRLAKILQAHQALYGGFKAAFLIDNHHASWATHFPTAMLTVGEFWGEIARVMAAVFALLDDDGDDTNNDSEQQSLAEAIDSLYNAVRGSTLITHGTHGNGWVSGGVGSTGTGVANLLSGAEFNVPPQDAIDRLAGILRSVAEGFAAINNKNHNPWLRADWQIEFQALCKTAHVATRKLRLAEADKLAASGANLRGDSSTVAGNQRYEVLNFARRYRLTEDEVLSLIRQVGNNRKTLAAEVARRRVSGEKILVPADGQTASPYLPA